MEESPSASKKSLMENLLGLLRVRVKRGVNLAVRDVRNRFYTILLFEVLNLNLNYLISII
jgi:hypothetical protein